MTSTGRMALAALPILAVEAAALFGCWQLARALWGWRGVRS